LASADREQLGADLSAYLDGELSPERARQVERLLEESEDARRLLAELRAVARNLGDLPRMHAPEGLSERIRHAAEGWVSPSRRSPATGYRVLKVVTRVVASAAVLVVCMYTGWIMHERLAPSPTSVGDVVAEGARVVDESAGAKNFAKGGGRGKRAPAEEPSAAPSAVAMRQLQSLGYIGSDADEELDASVGEAETFVAADRSGTEAELGAAAFGASMVADDATPTVSVVVAPQDVDQFNGALQLVSAWQYAPAVAGRFVKMESGEAEHLRWEGAAPQVARGRRGAGLSTLSQQEFVVQVPAGRVGEALQSLEQQAPQQVQVTMAFKPADLLRVQSMVTPGDPAPDLDEVYAAESQEMLTESAPAFARADTSARGRGAARLEKEAIEARRTGRGGRGVVERQPAAAEPAARSSTGKAGTRSAATVAETPEREEERLAYIHQAREGIAAAKGQPPPEHKKQALAEVDTSTTDVRSPLVADVARPTSELVGRRFRAAGSAGGVTMSQPASEQRAAADKRAAGAFISGEVEALRDDLTEIHAAMLDAASSAADEAAAAEDLGSVTLRVTVLPPPEPKPPASAPASEQAP
jgi:anti-sigma factor RsiW